MNVEMDKKSLHSHCKSLGSLLFWLLVNGIKRNKTSLRTPEGPSHLNYAPTADIENVIF